MQYNNTIEAIEFLSQFLTERRKTLIDRVLKNRTRYVTVVLEDVFKAQNASAVLRTCECQGIQDIYIIENNHQYEVNPDVVKGATKWLTLNQYPASSKNNTTMCFDDLRIKGYKLIGADPGGSKTIDELKVDEPIALVFGTEYAGLSETAKKDVDDFVTIPMYGFTESYNLSVSAALCLQTITKKLRTSNCQWELTQDELSEIKLSWYKGQVRDADALLKREFGT